MSALHTSPILVVDDDMANRYFKAHVLRQAGYKVLEAENGAKALAMHAAERPALVICDIKLPDIIGTEVTARIKASSPLTLVLQTSAAMTSKQDRIAGLEGGADNYLVEPIEPPELVATVRAMLRLAKAESELRNINEQLELLIQERTKELSAALDEVRSESERRAIAEETLRHAEKLDALGQLTGGVAHDFNNLLTVIMGGLEFVERHYLNPNFDRARMARYISGARHAAKDCARLSRQLLSFARRAPANIEPVEIDAAISGFAEILRQAVGARLTTTYDLRANRSCAVDRSQLEAALLNMAVNARDAMQGDGALHISTNTLSAASKIDFEPYTIALGDGAFPQSYLRISVSDSGKGIPADVLNHVFEPFFTTKDVGKGSGLGLSQVYGFVRQAGGYVTVSTAPDKGTEINLYLPCLKTGVGDAPTTNDATALPGGKETILVVEDNERVREVSSSLLDTLGYKTLAVENAHEALALLRENHAIDLLFSDVILPKRMSGVELASQARAMHADLKVLLTSGYARESEWAGASESGFPVILKPYTHSDLARRIRAILDAQ